MWIKYPHLETTRTLEHARKNTGRKKGDRRSTTNLAFFCVEMKRGRMGNANRAVSGIVGNTLEGIVDNWSIRQAGKDGFSKD